MSNQIISIIFTEDDVFDIAEALGIDRDVALDRADSWAKAITETSVSRINEALASVIEFDTP